MSTMAEPTQAILHEYLAYDERTGHLTWIKKPSNPTVLRSRAGSLNKASGYRRFTFRGKTYQEHRIIWCWLYGHYPDEEIDHEDQNRSNNSKDNLRAVTHAENSKNRRRNASRTGAHGIWYCDTRRRYVAEITVDGKKVYQRTFECADEAVAQRKAESLRLGFHENHGSIHKDTRKYYE